MDFTGERFIPEAFENNSEMTYEHLNRYVSVLDGIEGKIVLDAACGTGYGTQILSKTAKKIYGVDISQEAVDYAKDRYLSHNITFKKCSVTKLDLKDNFFDVVVSFETIEHIDTDSQKLFLSEIKRVLKKDGKLIISTPDKKNYTDNAEQENHFHIKEFYENEFLNFLKTKFNYVDFLYQRNEICNIISNNKDNNVKIIRKEHIDSTQGKYIIAICSNTKNGHENYASAQIQTDEFNKKIQRILDLQNEVEEKNRWAFSLNEDVKKLHLVASENIKFKKSLLEMRKSVEEKEKDLIDLRNNFGKIDKIQKSTAKENKRLKEELLLASKTNVQAKESIIRLCNIELYLKAYNGAFFAKFRNEYNKRDIIKLNRLFARVPKKFLEKFNAGEYLKVNHDIIPAIENKVFENAMSHFVLFGYDEILNGKRKLYENLEFFNEETYLDENSDVKLAVEEGKLSSAFEHYLSFGIDELVRGTRFSLTAQNKDMDLKIIDPKDLESFSDNPIEAPKFKNPIVSIVIPAYNQGSYTMACIQSIVENTLSVDYEIILMDDKSPDNNARYLDKYIKNITFISNEENLGFLLNCNKGASLARGKYILFLNNDTNVQADWLTSLVELIESDVKIGMVGSRLVYPDGRLQEAGGIIWRDASGWNYGRLDDPSKPEYNYVKEVDYISGASIMIRKSLWNDIGGFDKRYAPAYYEDTDLAFEVRKHGYKVAYQPKSVVVHFEGISNGTDTGSGIKKYQIVNKEKFFDKWKDVLGSENFIDEKDLFHARDRSRNKKTLLFIDHYVPHFDQDAGSRATYHYLKLLVNHDINIKFLGDNFYHYPDTEYVTALEKVGIEVLYGSYYAKKWQKWLEINGAHIDYVILSRPHISVKYIKPIKKYTNAKVIYFGVDLHYLREEREYEINKSKKILESSGSWKKIEFDLMKNSDLVCFYSEVEKNQIAKENPKINVIQIPLYIYDKFKETVYSHRHRQDIMFVGGFGHSPNVDAIVWFVEEVLPKIREKISCKFYVIGANATERINKYAYDNDDIIITGRISDDELERFYNESRVVVAPLRFGAGMKGKVVESMYNGIPMVTTSIGAEGLSDIDEVLHVADSVAKFAKLVIDIYTNESIGISLSKKSQAYCKKYFSISSANKCLFENGIDLLR